MSDRKGRLGVNYVCSVVAQAAPALPNPEFKSGEDHLAVDLNVEFPASPVRVQVKCGARKANKSGSISVPLHAKWRARWSQSKIPVYLVYVCLERSAPCDWIDHGDHGSTTVHAHAHWVRVNGVSAAMRPSRIIVGEVRAEEALDLLLALNSGLPGHCTLHANSAREALTKACTLPLLAGENIPLLSGFGNRRARCAAQPMRAIAVTCCAAVPGDPPLGRRDGDIRED